MILNIDYALKVTKRLSSRLGNLTEKQSRTKLHKALLIYSIYLNISNQQNNYFKNYY